MISESTTGVTSAITGDGRAGTMTGPLYTEISRANPPDEAIEDGLDIGRQLLVGLGMVLMMTLITGIIYPLVVTSIAQVAFPSQANGSIAYDSKAQPVGSFLLEQVFTDTKYFYGRPSASGTF